CSSVGVVRSHIEVSDASVISSVQYPGRITLADRRPERAAKAKLRCCLLGVWKYDLLHRPSSPRQFSNSGALTAESPRPAKCASDSRSPTMEKQTCCRRRHWLVRTDEDLHRQSRVPGGKPFSCHRNGGNCL